MGKCKVWTKQHISVLEQLECQGRYTSKREYVALTLEEHTDLVLEAYDWLVRNSPGAAFRPADAEYPVWVSYRQDAAMLPQQDTVLLELTMDEALITPIHVSKWGTILNFSYIPADANDARRHSKLLAEYGVSDAKAYLSRFYPEIREEIVDSWDRLFDDSVHLGSELRYGTIWEVRREWVSHVTR
ncbi:DUF3841 domain-containing protein [Oscillibacter sp. MSJ-2]|uniref:DUF3841 domain-containing protein n=1 Tax=Dysosmobacter acutus TaxID=2841504 RepID=A0ABS6F5W8_9FIRM|nr:DUF3841 domain-containing protein [Dysosmobacter acutus]MBU5625468.1 DUF3841 domain-containing protein [Dysosmobacter acutus]